MIVVVVVVVVLDKLLLLLKDMPVYKRLLKVDFLKDLESDV